MFLVISFKVFWRLLYFKQGMSFKTFGNAVSGTIISSYGAVRLNQYSDTLWWCRGQHSDGFDVIVLPLLWLATQTRRTRRHLATAHAPQTLVFQVPEARSAVDDITVLSVTEKVLFVQPCTTHSTPANIDADKLEHGFNPAEIITQNQHRVKPVKHFCFFGEVVHVFNNWLVKHLAFFKKLVVEIRDAFSLSPRIETRGDQTTQAKDEGLE